MQDRRTRRRLALALRAAGLALIAFSLSGAALDSGVAPSLAAPVQSLARIIVADASAAAAVTRPPVLVGTPTPGPVEGHGGPVTFSLSGALSVGQRLQNTTTAGGAAAPNQSSALGNAGMLATLQRRTATTTLQLSLPLGLALRTSSIGQFTAGYYTPKYGLEYGAQPLSFLGGVPFGQTLRGWAVILPLHGGDITFYRGPAYSTAGQILNVAGARGRLIERGTLVEFGLDRARGQDGSSADAVIAGAARSSGVFTQSIEGAFERMHNADGSSGRGFAYQYRADLGSGSVYGSFTSRQVTDGFLAFGSGALQRDAFFGGSLRYATSLNALGIDQSFENAGTGINLVRSQRSSIDFNHMFQRANIATDFTLATQKRSTQSGVDWTGTAGAQVGFNLFDISTLLGAQFQRATLSYGSPQALITYTSQLQRQLGPFALTGSYQTTRLTGNGGGMQTTEVLTVARQFGLSGVAFNLTENHTLNGAFNIVQSSPTFTISRRLSPATTLAVTAGQQRTRDLLNPLNDSRTRIFSIQIAAPFAIGNGIVQGRINPRLPATISGDVTNEVTGQGQFNFAQSISNGLANVVVVLDGKDVQRTDLSGHYQFNFVAAGAHEVRLESSSLPRGVTVDQPYASVNVQGGQSVQVLFRVGTYGAIAGHVYGRDSSGGLLPMSSVAVRLDNSALSVSDPFGAYSFGRLSAGTHTVEIVQASLPASVAFSKEAETQKITVKNGEIARLDFTANPLGSIAGFVTFGPDAGPGLTGGVNNAYVVAEPGDYAAITNQDGSYLLDNLPAGTYTLDLDPETLPQDTGNSSGPLQIDFTGESKTGVNFTVGHKLKAVVFSLKIAQPVGATLAFSEPALPPRGSAVASVDANGPAESVAGTAFGKRFAFDYDPARKRWIATIVVPASTAPGRATIFAEIRRAKKSQAETVSADLNIDPQIPLISIKMIPGRPVPGQYVTVRARILGDVQPGDTIRWLDGQITKLSRPVTGRVYVFSVKISERIMHGTLLTRQGGLPITLR
jgi:hypothetical protein